MVGCKCLHKRLWWEWNVEWRMRREALIFEGFQFLKVCFEVRVKEDRAIFHLRTNYRFVNEKEGGRVDSLPSRDYSKQIDGLYKVCPVSFATTLQK